MKFTFFITMLALFLSGCASDSLSMAARFYRGNPYADNSVASGLACIARAKKQYSNDRNKLSICSLLEALLLTEEGNDKSKIASAYKQALEFNPTNLTAAINLSNLYYNSHDTKEAIIYYKLALTLVNKDIEAAFLKEFPQNHIMNDMHMKIFLRTHKFNNPYFYEEWADTLSGNLDSYYNWDLMKNNLCKTKKFIEGRLQEINAVP